MEFFNRIHKKSSKICNYLAIVALFYIGYRITYILYYAWQNIDEFGFVHRITCYKAKIHKQETSDLSWHLNVPMKS